MSEVFALEKTLVDFTDYERTVLSWGLTATLAYLITYFYPEYAAAAWTTTIVINSFNYLYTTKLSPETNLNLFWIGSALLAAFLIGFVPPEIILPVLGGLVFYYTSLKTEDSSSRIYNTSALLNIATLLIYFLGSGTIELYLLLSFVQGAPMLIDFFTK